jgi:ATP synthase protein I
MADAQEPRDQEAEVSRAQARFGRLVEGKAARKLRARGETQHDAWFWLGMFGLVGWSVAVPTVIGISLGVWIDGSWPGRVSWTLTLMFVGVVVGAVNAWYWVAQESRRE